MPKKEIINNIPFDSIIKERLENSKKRLQKLEEEYIVKQELIKESILRIAAYGCCSANSDSYISCADCFFNNTDQAPLSFRNCNLYNENLSETTPYFCTYNVDYFKRVAREIFIEIYSKEELMEYLL